MLLRSRTFSLFVGGLSFTLAACAPAEDSGSDGADTASETPSNSSAPTAASNDAPMAKTGWVAIGADGAVYTTFFDPDGTYRDFRNGDPVQQGSWERREDARLCLIPAGEQVRGECWSTGAVDDEGNMRTVDGTGRAIELRRVTYIAPAVPAQDNDVADNAEGEGEG